MVDTVTRSAASATPLPNRSVVPPVWGRIFNLMVDHGEGSWLVTPEGERYLDYTSGIGVTNTGHAHPHVAAAVAAQAAKLLHGQQNIVYHEAGLRLYDRLAHQLPGGPWTAFLSNSGAEAVEAAVKLARVATGRPAIIAFRYSFHGRTAQTMALTAAKDVYRGAFEPLPGSIYHASYPYCYRASGGAHDPADCTCDWEAQLDLLFHQLVFPDKVAGIIIEPIMGEGGYIVPPPGFLPRLREITRQHGIMLIADEVQTGFGRTGEMFAVRHWDVEPDILVMAKGIASGLPLSGILARSDIMAKFPMLEPRLRPIEDPKRRRLTMYWMVRHAGPAQDVLRPEPADLERLKERVSPKARQVLDKTHDPDSVAKLAARWMQAAMFSKRVVPQVDPSELTRFYKEELKPEEREYLESLPAERMQHELTRRYLAHRFRQSPNGEMPPFFRPGGGPRGFGPYPPPGARPSTLERTPEARPDAPRRPPFSREERWKSKEAG